VHRDTARRGTECRVQGRQRAEALIGRIDIDVDSKAAARADSDAAARWPVVAIVGWVRRALARRNPPLDGKGKHGGLRSARPTPRSANSPYCSFLPRSVTRSKKPEISRLRKSTSAGRIPPAEAWPVTVPGLMVLTRTSRMWRAASTGSHSGLS